MPTSPRFLALLLVATIALTSCGGGDDNTEGLGEGECRDEVTLEATTLPSGFDEELTKGAGGGKDTPRNTVAYHWQGPEDDTYIDVFRGGRRTGFQKGSKFAFLDKVGRYKEIPGGLAAKVKLARARCSRYQLEAFGVSAEDFKNTLKGLRRAPGARAEDE